jgi:hypothetical protein
MAWIHKGTDDSLLLPLRTILYLYVHALLSSMACRIRVIQSMAHAPTHARTRARAHTHTLSLLAHVAKFVTAFWTNYFDKMELE